MLRRAIPYTCLALHVEEHYDYQPGFAVQPRHQTYSRNYIYLSTDKFGMLHTPARPVPKDRTRISEAFTAFGYTSSTNTRCSKTL